MTLNAQERKTEKAFLVELVLYAVLVVAYFGAVLHFMGGWLENIYREHRGWYAVLCLLLMVGQGVVLEMITAWLLNLARKRIR